ncbi:hypothetical protein PBRA_003424 [Plasmodiophora brassicae]|uniref:Uncharacterized protein n=1 Tax=Plasmodiophora brassicae TaxID=37360 RepID=A0A0G4J8H6_PLABS|nr:hypothetical protein PBRA_003424 [Plasmodiophora brassicae]
MEKKVAGTLTRRRDVRRDRLQVLLNKDAHGATVASAKSSEPSPPPMPKAHTVDVAAAASPTPAAIPNSRMSPSTSARERNLHKISQKFASMRAVPNRLRDDGTPLRVQRQQMLASTRANATPSANDDNSRQTFTGPVDDDKERSLNRMGRNLFGKIQFSDPLKKWNARRKHDHGLRIDVDTNEPESHHIPQVRETIASIMHTLKRRKREADSDSAEESRQEQAHDDAKPETSTMEFKSQVALDAPNDIGDEKEDEDDEDADEEGGDSIVMAGGDTVAPSVVASAPTATAPLSLSPGVASVVLDNDSLTKLELFSESAAASIHDLNAQIAVINDALDKLGDPDVIQSLLPVIQRLEHSVEQIEPRMATLIAESERRQAEKLQKLTLGFKRSLDALTERVDANQARIQHKGGPSATSTIQEYAISFFVLGLSTLLMPFGYVYQMATSQCQKRKRKPAREPRAYRRRKGSQ